MTRWDLACALAAGTGAAALLAPLPWFRRLPLHARLATPATHAPARRSPGPARAVERAWRTTTGRALARTHRGPELERVRLVAVSGGLVGLVVAALVATAAGLPGPVAVALLVLVPVGAILAPHVRVHQDAQRWRAEVEAAMPELCERLSLLVASGRSLPTALQACARRMRGPVAVDLAWLEGRLACGTDLEEVLDARAGRLDLAALDRLVAVLRLHHVTPDLGRLLVQEADAARAEAHRRLLARLDRRSEQVWIPVTVAALVPGAVFLLLPFLDALRAYSAP